MTQIDKPGHVPGPWDPLPEGYWVELRKYRPTDPGYYYLLAPESPHSITQTVDQRSGRFKPENVAKHFRPKARYHAENRANQRRERAMTQACKGISTEALEQGIVTEMLEALAQLLKPPLNSISDCHADLSSQPCVCGRHEAQDYARTVIVKAKD